MLDAKLDKEKAPPTVQLWTSTNLASVVRNIQSARAVLRAVILALGAQDDGSMIFDGDSGTSRWNAAVEPVCKRLERVRDELIGTAGAPYLDWVTSLTLAEALDAALWFGFSCEKNERLSNIEAVRAANVVIDSLDELLNECESIALTETDPVH